MIKFSVRFLIVFLYFATWQHTVAICYARNINPWGYFMIIYAKVMAGCTFFFLRNDYKTISAEECEREIGEEEEREIFHFLNAVFFFLFCEFLFTFVYLHIYKFFSGSVNKFPLTGMAWLLGLVCSC